MDIKQISELAKKYIDGTASSAELDTLHTWYDEQEADEEQIVVTAEPETLEALRARMLVRLLEEMGVEQGSTAMVRTMRPVRKWYWAAAATAVGIMIGGYFFFNRPTVPAETLAKEVRFKNDIPAGGKHAVLQLADGSTILLDSALNGTVAMQGGTTIVKNANGQLTYQTGGKNAAELYNAISTPMGGEYAITLPDGSKVWLNAQTSLRFPAVFTGKNRKVELTGEAYFEVAKNAAQPFVVGIGDKGNAGYREVEVLGTHFNIKAYTDETEVKATLLEGKVKISVPASGTSQVMNPGQQVNISGDGELKLVDKADTDVVMAWHNGLFRFNGVSIREVMAQAKRWYGIDVIYKGGESEHFKSGIPRQSTLQEFLTILETTGRVQFSIDGKTVTVAPAK